MGEVTSNVPDPQSPGFQFGLGAFLQDVKQAVNDNDVRVRALDGELSDFQDARLAAEVAKEAAEAAAVTANERLAAMSTIVDGQVVGVLEDPDSATAAALNSTYVAAQASAAPSAAKLATKLEQGLENAVVAVVGDSTGNANDEWVYLLAQSLAARYPAYTVTHRLWNDGTQAYDAATIIQTGTGAFTLDVYNASTPGKGPQYSTPRLALQLPVEPDLIFINYGHNLSFPAAEFMSVYYRPLMDAIDIRWPSARIICSSQNKRVAPAANLTLHPLYMARIKDLCAERGYGYLPVWEAFDAGDATALNDPDGFHPNDDGSILWGNIAASLFDVARVVNPSARRPLDRTSVFVPAPLMRAANQTGGFPLYGVTNELPVWKFDKTTAGTQSMTGWCDLPADWKTVNIKVLWAAESADAGNMRLRCQVIPWAVGAVPARDTANVSTATGVGVLGQVIATTLRTAFALPSSRLGIFLLREFGDGADTLTGVAAIQGFLIERVS